MTFNFLGTHNEHFQCKMIFVFRLYTQAHGNSHMYCKVPNHENVHSKFLSCYPI